MLIEYDDEQRSEVTGGGESQRGSIRKISTPKKLMLNQFLEPYLERSFARNPAYAGLLDEIRKEAGDEGSKSILIALKNVLGKKLEQGDVGRAKVDALSKWLASIDAGEREFNLNADEEAHLTEIIDDAVEGFGPPKQGRAPAPVGAPGSDTDEQRRIAQERDAFRKAAEKERARATGMKTALADTTRRAKKGEELARQMRNVNALFGDKALAEAPELTDKMLRKAGVPKELWEAARMHHQVSRTNTDLAMQLKGQTDIANATSQELEALKAKAATPAPTADAEAAVKPVADAAAKGGKWAKAKQKLYDFLMPTESMQHFGEATSDIKTSMTPQFKQLQQMAQTLEGGGVADEAAVLRGTDKTAIKELLDWMASPGQFTGGKAAKAARGSVQTALQGMAPEAVAALEKGVPKALGGVGKNIGKLAGAAGGLATSLPADLLAFIGTPWVLSQIENVTGTPVSWESKRAEMQRQMMPTLDDAIVGLKRDEFEQELAMKSLRENPDMLAAVQRQMQSHSAVRAGTTPHETRIGGSSDVTGANPLDIFGGN